MNIIVAVDKNWGIGKGNKLLFSVPEDMKFFKNMTTGNTVVMGSNTFFSLPGASPLKNRINIVLSKNTALKIDGATVVRSLDELFSELSQYPSEDVFIIGGAAVYKTLLPFCSTAYVTKIDAEADGADVFFENLDRLSEWRAEAVSEEFFSNGYKLRFWKYKNNNIRTSNSNV